MSKLTIQKVEDAEDRMLSAFAEFEGVADRIRGRAYDLFVRRGYGSNHAMDDWLTAEREICWPTAELIESATEYRLEVALPGFRPADVTVTATAGELLVKATRETAEEREAARAGSTVRWSEFCGSDVFRRIVLPEPIVAGEVAAKLSDGLLAVVAPKAKGNKPAKKKKKANKKSAGKKSKRAPAKSAKKKTKKKARKRAEKKAKKKAGRKSKRPSGK